MTADRLKEYLNQMRSNAAQAIALVADMEPEAFLADVRTQLAIGMTLVLIGEAASKIAAANPEFPVDHPEIPWSKIRGMRNLVVHDYYQLELPVVFDTVKTSLPDLLDQLHLLHDWHAQGE